MALWLNGNSNYMNPREEHLMKYLILLAATIGLVTACSQFESKKSQTEVTKIDTNKIQNNRNLTVEQRAEQLALAGEQLMSFGGFVYAEDVFNQALIVDAKNQRAMFYKKLLGPIMTLRGVMARVEPLVKKDANAVADYDNALKDLPNSSVRDFLLEGKPDIKTEKDVQKLFDAQYAAYNDFRVYLKENKDLNLTLNLPSQAWDQRFKTHAHICTVTHDGNGIYNSECKTNLKVFQIKLERADIEAMQQVIAGVQIYQAIFNAYDVSGVHDLILDNSKNNTTYTDEEIVNILKGNQDFGKLRADQQLTSIIGMGKDGLAGVRWAVKKQKELCPEPKKDTFITGEDQMEFKMVRRPGTLFEDGICIDDGANTSDPLEKTLKMVELALNGNPMNVYGTDRFTGQEIQTQVRYSQILSQPIKDLKAQAPTKYTKCGKASQLPDQTIGGLFVLGDANNYLTRTGSLFVDEDCMYQ